jgi:hypothetical protein
MRLDIEAVRKLPRQKRAEFAAEPFGFRERGVMLICPPNARIISVRSLLTPSGMTARNRSPIWAQASAMAMLVEPLDASMTRSPGRSSPLLSACSRM